MKYYILVLITCLMVVFLGCNNGGDDDGSSSGDTDGMLTETRQLLGTWHFFYTILSPFDNTYSLNTVEQDKNDQGAHFVTGNDEYGNYVNACYWPNDGYWSLLDPGQIINRFFVFYINNGTIGNGSCYYQIEVSTGNWSRCYTLSGSKISSASSMVQLEDVISKEEIDFLERFELEEAMVDEKNEITTNNGSDTSILDKYYEHLETR